MTERLWAPWRIGFLVGPKTGGCFMCEAISADPGRDRDTFVLERGARCFVIMNRYPYTNGHLLVAPHAHEGEFTRLDADVLTEVGLLTQRWIGILRSLMRPAGFNVGWNLGECAGAGVADHVHQHIVPRWNGDHNFMSTCADTRMINQSLEEAWAQLSAASCRPDDPNSRDQNGK